MTIPRLDVTDLRGQPVDSHGPIKGEATMVEPVTLEVFTDYI